ncbi:MAG TPA: hypothetical protein DDY78_08610 [Planctomycetales bacterium]|nr:hypothetical protein [Planctomycetales bacterium]
MTTRPAHPSTADATGYVNDFEILSRMDKRMTPTEKPSEPIRELQIDYQAFNGQRRKSICWDENKAPQWVCQ